MQAVLDGMRPLTAMYVGGMGSATHNYHREAMARRGFPEAAARIQELWLAGRKDEAVAAVPDDVPRADGAGRIAHRIGERWEHDFAPRGTGVTGLIVGTDQPEGLELLADLAGTRDRVGRDGRSVSYELILVDTPARSASARITLNRPEKRNAISTPLRTELLDALAAVTTTTPTCG